MPEQPIGERVATLEGVLSQVLPAIQRMEGKLDDALNGMQEKGSRASVAEAHAEIDKIQLAMKDKVDKEQLETAMIVVKADVKQVRDRMLLWTGSLAALFVLGNWLIPPLLRLLFQ